MKRLVRVTVAVALVGVVLVFADWQSVWRVLRSVNLAWVGLALLLALVDRLLINVRYELLLVARHLNVGFWRLFRVQLAANFLGSFLPSSVGVDAVRIAALCRSGLPSAPVVAATLVDRVSLVLATLVFGSATLIALAGSRVPGHLIQFVWLSTALAMLVIVTALHPIVRRLVRARIVPRLPERFRHTTTQIADASLSYRHEWAALLWTAVTTLVLLLVRIGFAKSLALACGLNVPFLDLLLVIPILWIVVMLPITIGGIGVQDAGYVLLMSIIGVGPAVAFSMSILEHVISRLASLPGALFLGEAEKRPPSDAVSGP